MRWFWRILIGGIFGGVTVWLVFFSDSKLSFVSPLSSSKIEAKPTPESTVDYSLYTFEALAQRKYESGKIKLGAVLAKEDNYNSYVFTYQSDGKTISGMANIPLHQTVQGFAQGKFPVVVLLRGYADKENYHIGLGTEKSANFLAENGFLTLAPDFLGYGKSDQEDSDILIARFQCPVAVLDLLSIVGSLPSADSSRIGLWGHSNGAQIVLSILEITGKAYPTSLWAPVSLGFPESILVYLGTEDVGNIVKEKIDEFSLKNDPKKFSIAEYFDKITTNFIVHQGAWDELIKPEWTENLVQNLKSRSNSVDFYSYPKENHNFNRYKTTGEILRERDLEFFKKWLK